MSQRQEINEHNQKIERGKRVCYAQRCPHCKKKAAFRLHDRRRRGFRFIEEAVVVVLKSWLLRWICTACKGRFTDYPPFRSAATKDSPARPCWAAAKAYLGEPGSCKKHTHQQARPRFYQGDETAGQPTDDPPVRALAASTLWRWLDWLGNLPHTLLQAFADLRRKNPQAAAHREPVPVDPARYRSPQRGEALRRAAQMILVDQLL